MGFFADKGVIFSFMQSMKFAFVYANFCDVIIC